MEKTGPGLEWGQLGTKGAMFKEAPTFWLIPVLQSHTPGRECLFVF